MVLSFFGAGGGVPSALPKFKINFGQLLNLVPKICLDFTSLLSDFFVSEEKSQKIFLVTF